MESAVQVGSAGWIGAGDYQVGSEFQRRANKFLDDINWARLTEVLSRKRDGIPGAFADNFSIGHFNMVRRLEFEDGVSWAVRLRMPELVEEGNGLPCQNVQRLMSSEVACMEFFRSINIQSSSLDKIANSPAPAQRLRGSVPVPEVYHYDFDPANEVGAPYIAMEYIPGTVASELQARINGNPFMFGTPDQDQKFRRQMAAIQVEMSSIQFDQIGSLYRDPVTRDFYIGPDAETGLGPWSSSIEYYRDLARHKLEEVVRSTSVDAQEDYSYAFPVLFERLIEMYAERGVAKGPFGFAHRDFGAHNLLVDENFEIIAVIDFDGLTTAPVESQAQFPNLTGLDMEPPFCSTTNPYAIERIEKTLPKMIEYKQMVQERERESGKFLDQSATPGGLMMSDTAAIVLGLQEYDMHNPWRNRDWMNSLSRLLYQKVASKIKGDEED